MIYVERCIPLCPLRIPVILKNVRDVVLMGSGPYRKCPYGNVYLMGSIPYGKNDLMGSVLMDLKGRKSVAKRVPTPAHARTCKTPLI